MSKEFFKAVEKLTQQKTYQPHKFEIRAYYDDQGIIYDMQYVDSQVENKSTYIVLTQEQYDGINRKRHRVIDKKLVWTTPKAQHWYLKQSDLSTNPYIKD